MSSYIGRGRGEEVTDRDIIDVGDVVEGCLRVEGGHHGEIWVDLGMREKFRVRSLGRETEKKLFPADLVGALSAGLPVLRVHWAGMGRAAGHKSTALLFFSSPSRQ